MYRKLLCWVAVIGVWFASGQIARAQPRAFGEAEGFGAVATGGRGGTIYHVTNLNDTGAGSFRDAVSGSNRIVVFDVGGYVHLASPVSAQSNLTILGQTAPGDGIGIYGAEVSFYGRSNDIVRFVRFRDTTLDPGYNGSSSTSSSSSNCLNLGNTNNMIFDHVSCEFAAYNNVDAAGTTGAPNLTFQNSIVAAPIASQRFNFHWEGGGSASAGWGDGTFVNNVFIDGHNRSILAKGDTQYVNNTVYNYQAGFTSGNSSGTFSYDVVGNYFITGPSTTSSSNDIYQVNSNQKAYASGNLRDSNADGVLNGSSQNTIDSAVVLTSAWSTATASLPQLSAANSYAYNIAHAGASIKHDVTTFATSTGLDQVDAQMIANTQTLGTAGRLWSSETQTGLTNGGLGVLNTGAKLTDTDNDGIPDSWETAHGMNPASAADALLTDPLGYRMLEKYANELGDVNTSRTWSGASGNWTSTANWTGTTLPGVFEHALIRGNGAASAAVTSNSTTNSAISLSIGGNGLASGETLTVSAGTLNIFDTVIVGDQGNATVNVTGGTLSAYNIQLGNTAYLPAATNFAGTLNLSGGTLKVAQIVLGAGVPGSWTSGGSVNFSGGTMQAFGNMLVSAPVTVTGTTATIDTNGLTGSITGGLFGAGNLTKIGGGTLTLGGNNSAYSGAIGLNVGAITLATSSANSSPGVITAANGTQINVTTSGASTPLTVANGATVTLSAGGITYGGVLNGAVGTTLSVSTTSSGTSNFSMGGDISNFAGTFDLAASTGNVRINLSGSSLANFNTGTSTGTIRTAFDGTTNFGSLAGDASTKLQGSTNGTGVDTYVIGANSASTTFAGTITDGTNVPSAVLNITKTGIGTLTLSNAASTYTGITTINAGVLAVSTLGNGGVASGLGQSSNAAANLVLSGGALQYTGAATTTDRLFTLNPTGGRFDASGTGAITLSSTGDIVVSGSGNRTLSLGGTSAAFNNISAALGDPVSGKTSLVKDGAGTWRLFGNPKTYSGDTTVNAGKLYLVATNILPAGAGKGNVNVAAGATIDLYGSNQAINGLNGAGTVTTTLNTVRTLTVGNGDANGAFTGSLTQGASQTLGLVKTGSGTQALSGTDSYTGSTTVNGGTLAFGSDHSLPGGINVTSGTAGIIAVGDSTNVVAPQPALLAAGGDPSGYVPGDKYVITNTLSVATGGHFDVNDGILVVNNGDQNTLNALVQHGNPRSTGALGNYHPNQGEILSSTAKYDYNNFSAVTALGWVDNFNTGYLGIGSNNQLTKTGATITIPSALGIQFIFKYTYAGDTNLDGKVDNTDLSNLVANYGQITNPDTTNPVTWFDGDFNGDGVVDSKDLAILVGNYNAGTTGSSFGPLLPATSVPEPSSLILLLLGLSGAAAVTCRRAHAV
jgi:autotransporter-associated beta strand protein